MDFLFLSKIKKLEYDQKQKVKLYFSKLFFPLAKKLINRIYVVKNFK